MEVYSKEEVNSTGIRKPGAGQAVIIVAEISRNLHTTDFWLFCYYLVLLIFHDHQFDNVKQHVLLIFDLFSFFGFANFLLPQAFCYLFATFLLVYADCMLIRS